MAERAPPPALDQRSRAWVLLATLACLVPLLLQLVMPLGPGIGVVAVVVALLARRTAMAGWMRVLLALLLAGAVFAVMGLNFGRDTGCALLAAMLAIKPAETATLRDGRSLVGFALFAPFATFLLDQGPVSLLLGVAAAAFALVALQQMAEAESGEARAPRPAWRRFGTVGRMVAIGLPLALAAFWLFPRMASPMWGAPDRAQARPGLADSMSPGQWVDLLTDDSPAARARFFGATPPQEAMYWRGPVMLEYDGRTWRQLPWMRYRAAPETTPSRPAWDYELELEPTDRRQLVALDLPLAAPEGASLGADFSLRTTREPLREVSRWRMRSSRPRAFEPVLERSMRRLALELPPGFNPRAVALAREWREAAGADDAAIVERALRWIGDEFAYTLAVLPPGRHAVDEFLFDTKAGYCEQFSSSFTVLMRAAGIPARVVGGYAGGEYNRLGAYWLLRRSDAHAWTEVWLDGRGWVRVDPTAAVAPERVFDTLADRANAEGSLIAPLLPAFQVGDWLRRGWNDFVLGFDASRQAELLRPLGIDRIPPEGLVLLFGLVAVLALAAAIWLVTREARERDPVLRAWRRLDRRYRRLGLGREPHEPAGDWARRVLAARPQDVGLNALSRRFADWRYALRPDEGARTRAAFRGLVRDLRAFRPLPENPA
jgi:transglutaminase-like putative cysteine protease